VVFGNGNLSSLVPPCGLVWPVRRERLIFGDAVVFGAEILAGKTESGDVSRPAVSSRMGLFQGE
jgi:hypothetical protein